MNKLYTFIGASLLVLAASGCAAITSGMPTETNVTGEAWYVKTVSFISLPVSTHIYFCPKPQGKAPAKCIEALVHDANPTPAAPEMPAGYGAPQQPGGYGTPQQPGGYGAPQQPGGYGVPQQPGGYGAPPTGGYQQPTAPAPHPPTPGY